MRNTAEAGTPRAWQGKQIPLQARIVTVADTFDAMTTTRPYQQAMEIDYVVGRIRLYAGARYDPVVVEAFLRAYEKGNLMPIPVRPALEEPEEPRAWWKRCEPRIPVPRSA